MPKQEQSYKMGRNWMKRFFTLKKKEAGWFVTDLPNGNQLLSKPDQSPFALFEPSTGLVHTSAHVMDIQW